MAAADPGSRPDRVAAAPEGLFRTINVGGGNLNKSQAASKIKSSPKGTGTGLPSVAQGKKPGGWKRVATKAFLILRGKPAAAARLRRRCRALKQAHLPGERWLPRVRTA